MRLRTKGMPKGIPLRLDAALLTAIDTQRKRIV